MSRTSAAVAAASSGCYSAARASALSGVPERTVYDWARKRVVVPSVSPVQEKLWSYADLMALRLVAWLRRPKELDSGSTLPANPMSQVRGALDLLDRWDLSLWNEDAPAESPVVVDQRGALFVARNGRFHDLAGNVALPHEERFGLLSPFELGGLRGPDLRAPRPSLRIIPARVAGEPHVAGTRVTTQTLAALLGRGYDVRRVAEMYQIPIVAVEEALDLEADLEAA